MGFALARTSTPVPRPHTDEYGYMYQIKQFKKNMDDQL